jgi:hypothetical protein
MQITRLTVLVEHSDSISPQDVAGAVASAMGGPEDWPAAWTVGAVTVAEPESSTGDGTRPGWHITTCGWCGGEATHEDNCKNDS